MNTKLMRGVVCLMVLFAVVFTTCEMDTAKETPKAADPSFESDLLDNEITEAGSNVNLSVQVPAPSDGGKITYQWYSLEAEYDNPVGTPIDGETFEYITLDSVAAGIHRYYVAVTNSANGVSATVNSKIVTVTVNPSGPIKYPVITQHPAGGTYLAGPNPVELKINTKALRGRKNADGTPIPDDAGELSFQWFGIGTAGNKGGGPIDFEQTTVDPDGTTTIKKPDGTRTVILPNGAQTIYKPDGTSTPSTVAAPTAPGGDTTTNTTSVVLDSSGTFYFYCVVTNTDSSAPDPLSVSSHPATFTIRADMAPNATVTVYPNRRKQYVRGYGGMDIPWDNFYRIYEHEYEKMFNPDTGLGLNMLRIMIMPGVPQTASGGTNTNEVTYTSIEDTMKYYLDGDGNRPEYYKGVQIVNKYGGYVLASPWSPPPQWKSNNSKNGGGFLKPAEYKTYAQYLKDFCKHMYDKGAPIYAVSIQNEPNFKATYDGCEWSNEEMRDFFKEVGHFTSGVKGSSDQTPVKGWGGGKEIPVVLTMNGESANNPSINNEAMNDLESRAVIDLLARHTYGDVQIRYAMAHDTAKKEIWMTEHNINSGNTIAYPNDYTWNYVWLFMNDIDVSIRLNDENAWIWWAIKRFYSIIGDGKEGSTEGTIYPRGYGLSHYAKFSKEMYRTDNIITGTTAAGVELNPGANINNKDFDRNSVAPKITSFVSEDGNTVSLVMWTPTTSPGTGGHDMGTVEIKMPDGWIIGKAEAMRSNAAVKAKAEDVTLSANKNSAYILLPRSNIVSVRFTKAQ